MVISQFTITVQAYIFQQLVGVRMTIICGHYHIHVCAVSYSSYSGGMDEPPGIK